MEFESHVVEIIESSKRKARTKVDAAVKINEEIGLTGDAMLLGFQLPTIKVANHTPPRFPNHVIQRIRQGASMLFQSFGLRDFAKIDGWFVPNHVNLIPTLGKDIKFGLTESGTILFTDINLVSGMEQTSFLFQQASKVFTILPPVNTRTRDL